MKKFNLVVFGTLVVVGAIWITLNYLPQLVGFIKGIRPVITPPPRDISRPGVNDTDLPLNLPDNFGISIFASGVEGARVLTWDPMGRLLVSLTSEGRVVALPDENVDHKADKVLVVTEGLNRPHGLAMDCEGNAAVQQCKLYIGETNQVSVFDYNQSEARVTNKRKLVDLPSGGGHFTRTIAFGPDQRLYVSIGSSCNVCNESDDRRAKIFSMNKDSSDFREYARGLRNAVFFTWSYVDGRMWATEMGRDHLGDDLPPDEINLIREGGNYGWPTCYGKNIHDTDFDKNTYIRNPCEEPTETGSHVDLPAHSAPLGLAFVPEEGWPEEYWYDLIVAYHGSWNRSEPTGYKLVRVKLDAQGNYEGTEDFITGWLEGGTALGRPVDVLIQPGGVMYVSDDKAGVVYRVTYGHDISTQSFEDCLAAGYPVMESYPRQCRLPSGKTLVEDIGNELEKQDLIRISTPRPNQEVKSPLLIEGEARGTWFFEASFPVRLLDEEGKEIAIGIAQAQGEWMTEEFVPFALSLNFSKPGTAKGTLVLEKDNPSGLPANADELRIPVRFQPQ